ncbi:hypothetical protein MOQ_002125 [Trypanosoma cruzi marinkellei]|uniref:C2 domain-containing protein n=1 Tax=Trypanosoma cruzi marinkellei TaxID=85056 RepID=K2P9A4_TRYCR|nr:hypothetical protein MOQ_002125 [Trypanosoma cruzi marinkellei]
MQLKGKEGTEIPLEKPSDETPLGQGFSPTFVDTSVGGGREHSRAIYTPQSERSCSLTVTGQRPFDGMSFFNAICMPGTKETKALTFSFKKKRGRKGRNEAQVPLLVEQTTEALEEKTFDTNTVDYNSENLDVICTKLEEMPAVVDGRMHLQMLNSSARAQAPWWVRRWTELKLFLNSTLVRGKYIDSVIGMAMDQLAADLDAVRVLEKAVADNKDVDLCQLSASRVENIEKEEGGEKEKNLLSPPSLPEDERTSTGTRASGEHVTSEMLAQLVPPWLYVGTGRRMTQQLSQTLAVVQNKLVEKMSDDVEGAEMRLLGIFNHGGYDGTQRVFLCPAVQRLHASVVRKSILMDLFASQMNLRKKRAQFISDGFWTQTPRIHADYITDEDIRPLYDPTTLHQLGSNDRPCLKETGGNSLKEHSLFIHIDYIRFRPTATSAWQHAGEASLADVAPPWRGGPNSDAGMKDALSMASAGNYQPQDNGNTKPLVTFTQEERIVSDLLDKYEQYRMVELNFLPHLKSRRFYKEQLENLERQPRPTEEQKKLKASLLRLLNLTCELERLYIKEMVSAWRRIARLRGENPDDCFAPLPPSSVGVTPNEESTPLSHSHLTSQKGGVEGIGLRRGFLGLSEGAVSLLSDGPSELQAQMPTNARLRLYSRHHSEGVVMTPIQEEHLLEYTPVIEGVIAPPHVLVDGGLKMDENGVTSPPPSSPQLLLPSSSLQHGNSTLFQVLIFVRTSFVVPPHFVGCTAPRALNSSKMLFLNETFELRTLQEPQEILLHILSMRGGSDGDCVIATVSIFPSITRAHLLLPLPAPISFSYRGKTYRKYRGGVLPGLVSVSTTWTTIKGMTVEEIEGLFLRGDADPLDPQHGPLLATLKAHYMELRGHTTTLPSRTEVPLPGFSEGVTSGMRHRGRCSISTTRPPVPLEGADCSRRLELLHRRWLFYMADATLQDAVEARLFSQPIPLEEFECYELQRRVEREAQSERRELKFRITSDAQPLGDAGVDLLPRVFIFSPFSSKDKLHLWRERLRHLKARRTSSRKLEDHELLERLFILPKLQPVKGIHLTPESHLNPRREARPKVDKTTRESLLVKQDSRIVVHIMRATTLPQRADGTPLEPFVEVGFVCEAVVSRSEVGTSPSWFETLNIPFSPPDFDDETLSLIEDDIVISVYDKVEIPMASTSLVTGVVSHETHYRTERRLLGTLRLPFFTLYEADQARVEGQFPLSTPRWILGYLPDGPDATATINPLKLRGGESTHSHPSIQLYIALWPPLRRTTSREIDQSTISRLLTQLNVSPQLHYLHGIAMKWRRDALIRIKALSSVNPVAQMREIEPFVFCTTGDLTLVCRYLLANGGTPPLTTRTVEEAIRFVSLLPFCIDTLTWGDKDVWSTNAEFLRIREGDYEELSLLLAHFLRFLAPEEATFVVTGRGVVHHHVVMVLHSFGGELRLIDPRAGCVCPVHDPHLRFFRDVHMVVSHNQLWANVQLSGAPHRMEWNLNDRRFWLPCFDHEDENVKACLPYIAAIQRQFLLFSMPEPQKEREIEQQLRKAVRRALVGWRNNRRLAFHHGVAPILQVLLKDAEDELCQYASVRREAVTMRAGEMLNDYFGDELLKDPFQRKQWRGEYRSQAAGGDARVDVKRPSLCIMGSPVNAAYEPNDATYQSILQKVFETAVHEVGTNAVSFAIGVYVKGYVSDVYSMWVFLVALYEVPASSPH